MSHQYHDLSLYEDYKRVVHLYHNEKYGDAIEIGNRLLYYHRWQLPHEHVAALTAILGHMLTTEGSGYTYDLANGESEDAYADRIESMFAAKVSAS